MTIYELELEINQFFLDSEKETDDKGIRQKGIYPNAVILTEAQYKEFLKELFNVSGETQVPDGVFISSICGLKTIISEEDLVKPRVVRM
jgi:hypothetical protein